MASERIIEVPMPEPGGYAACPSGDTEYEQAVTDALKKGVPDHYEVVKVEHKNERTVRHFALVTVRPKKAPPGGLLEWAKKEYELRRSYSGDPDPGGTAMLKAILDNFDTPTTRDR